LQRLKLYDISLKRIYHYSIRKEKGVEPLFSDCGRNGDQGLGPAHAFQALDFLDYCSEVVHFREFDVGYGVVLSGYCVSLSYAFDFECGVCDFPYVSGLCIDQNISFQAAFTGFLFWLFLA